MGMMATFGILCLFTFGIAVIQSVEHSRLIRSGGMTAKVKAEWTAARLLLVGFLCALATVTGLAPLVVRSGLHGGCAGNVLVPVPAAAERGPRVGPQLPGQHLGVRPDDDSPADLHGGRGLV